VSAIQQRGSSCTPKEQPCQSLRLPPHSTMLRLRRATVLRPNCRRVLQTCDLGKALLRTDRPELEDE